MFYERGKRREDTHNSLPRKERERGERKRRENTTFDCMLALRLLGPMTDLNRQDAKLFDCMVDLRLLYAMRQKKKKRAK